MSTPWSVVLEYTHVHTVCVCDSVLSSLWSLSVMVSSVKPNLWDHHHSSAISTTSLATAECTEMLCCQLPGSDFSTDGWRRGQ